MCEFCQNENHLITLDIEKPSFVWFEGSIDKGNTTDVTLGVFIDRGFLRLVDITDDDCLEAGEKIKINFCPICGDKIK
jgi:hypothetical protein